MNGYERILLDVVLTVLAIIGVVSLLDYIGAVMEVPSKDYKNTTQSENRVGTNDSEAERWLQK